jgi:hypothetical protein
MTPDPQPDWSRIPPSLAFVIEPAKRYGHIQFEEQVEAFEGSVTDEEKTELRKLAERLWEERNGEDGHALVGWVTRQDLVKHPEAARVEFLMVLLNKLGYC